MTFRVDNIEREQTPRMNDSGENNIGDSEDQSSPNSIFTIICIFNVPPMLISILGNAVVLAAIKRTPSIHSASMSLISSLAVSDFLVGVIGQPIYIGDLLTKNSSISQLSIIVGFSVCTVSLLTITAISVDRLLASPGHNQNWI